MGLSYYKLRIKYAKCHFSEDNVIESSDPSNVFSVKMCLSFTFRVSTHIHFPIKQINICLLHSNVSVSERFQCISAIWLVLPPFNVLWGLCLVRDGLSSMRLWRIPFTITHPLIKTIKIHRLGFFFFFVFSSTPAVDWLIIRCLNPSSVLHWWFWIS